MNFFLNFDGTEETAYVNNVTYVDKTKMELSKEDIEKLKSVLKVLAKDILVSEDSR